MADSVTGLSTQVSETVCQGVVDVSTHTFTQPEKAIKGVDDIPRWEKSQAYGDLTGFILTLNEAVKGKKISDTYPVSKPIQKIVGVLETLSGWIDEIPPVDQPQRFGNKAFRDFFTRLQQNTARLLTECLGEKNAPAIDELSVYLLESVGNSTRIDYGTGHELSFVAFLCCLYKIGVLTTDDYVATVLRVFERYMELVRKLQKIYRMEPAGSHGVWSLDDYQFIPFIWGSSQLLGHPRIQPKSFPKPEISEHFSKDFMFLGCIKYINEVKTGPFPEHSNQLWNISGVGKWDKVNSGLIKMYKAEVLAKFPVIQHFMFGSLLTLQPVK
ncbi:serine/threonine-protein phosphatase 2A activator-like isoform X2 [Haliotis asinina]|uniref:serine/threonine-protein phosphatase 2A activator-like isoform X2 n=1 Tax=Haliotis asinina TaxID=109174 RepID=UPI0035324788